MNFFVSLPLGYTEKKCSIQHHRCFLLYLFFLVAQMSKEVHRLWGKCISYVRRKDTMWTQFHQLHFAVSWYCACSKKSLCTGWVFIKSCEWFFVGVLIPDKPYCNLSQFTECLAYLPGGFTVLPCLEVVMKTYFLSVCYYSNCTYYTTPFSQLAWEKAKKENPPFNHWHLSCFDRNCWIQWILLSKMWVQVVFGRKGHSHFETWEIHCLLVTISQAVDAPIFKHTCYS